MENNEKGILNTDFFERVKSYNTTIISIGYGTFFAILLIAEKNVPHPILKYSFIAILISASTFLLYEIINQVIFAWQTRKVGPEWRFRYWSVFFITSFLFGLSGVILLLRYLIKYF